MKMISFGLWLLGGFKSFCKFLAEHWRVVLPLVLVALIVLTILHYKNAYEQEKKDFSDYIALVKEESRLRDELNKRVGIEHAKQTLILKNQHASIIEYLRGQYNASLKNKDSTINSGNAMRDSLRRQLADATKGLPEHSGGSIRLAEVGADSNAADTGQAEYTKTLEYACAITTADYNTLYDRCDSANKVRIN